MRADNAHVHSGYPEAAQHATKYVCCVTQARIVATRAELELKPLPFPDVSGMPCRDLHRHSVSFPALFVMLPGLSQL